METCVYSWIAGSTAAKLPAWCFANDAHRSVDKDENMRRSGHASRRNVVVPWLEECRGAARGRRGASARRGCLAEHPVPGPLEQCWDPPHALPPTTACQICTMPFAGHDSLMWSMIEYRQYAKETAGGHDCIPPAHGFRKDAGKTLFATMHGGATSPLPDLCYTAECLSSGII